MKRFFIVIIFSLFLGFVPQMAEAAFSFSQSGPDDLGDTSLNSLNDFYEFDGYLYACVQHESDGLEVWRTQDPANLAGGAPSTVWSKVVDDGFGDSQNGSCNDFIEFGDELYLSTQKEVDPGELWRTSNGTSWSQVGSDGFGDLNNFGIGELVSFGGSIYAATVNTNDGSEIWKSDANGENFTKIAITDGGHGDAGNTTPREGIVFNNAIYFGYYNLISGAELWRSVDGANWSQVNSDGFGDAGNDSINDLEEFGGFLYATTSNGAGGELWRSSTADVPVSFSQVAGATDGAYVELGAMSVRNDVLFLSRNQGPGSQFLSSANGTSFVQQNTDGFGDIDYVQIPAIGFFNDVTVISTNDFSGNFKVFYPDLSPTVSTVVGTPRVDNSGRVDVSFNVDTFDGADRVEARVQYSVNGTPFVDATLFESDADAIAKFGDPKIENSNANQIGNSAGYIETSSGENTVRVIWDSLRDQANLQSNNVKIRVRGFSGTNGSYVESAAFTISNSDTTPPRTIASPAGGSYNSTQLITLTCSDGGSGCDETYFTVNGSDPKTSGVLYTGPISVQQSSQLRFFSRDHGGNEEDVQSELYVITSQGASMVLTNSVAADSGAIDGGNVIPGDVLTYRVEYRNAGQINAFDVTLSDIIPVGTEYISNSIFLNNAQITDALDGDSGDFDHTLNNQVYIDLGVVAPGQSGFFTYKVKVKNSLKSGDRITNRARAAYNPWGLVSFSNEVTNTHLATGQIAGLVFDDQNGNGVRERFESGIRSAQVRIYEDRNRNGRIDGGDFLTADLRTNADGEFSISGMSAGFYIIDVNDASLATRYRLTTNNDPGQVVLSRSDQVFNSAVFGYRRSLLVPGPGVAGGTIQQPRTPTPTNPTNPQQPTNPTPTVPDVPAIIMPDLPDFKGPDTPSVSDDPNPVEPDVQIDPDPVPVIEPAPEEGNVFFDRSVEYGLAPLALAAAAVNFIAGISFAGTLLPYLQYLLQIFTEPFRYFGVRKPEKYGVVYNVLTNEPIDLAIVRLYNKQTGQLVESSVTDSRGRYYFVVDPHQKYQITVTRDGFNFPSRLMEHVDDSQRLYGGGDINFNTPNSGDVGIITYQIPVDPQQGEVFIDDNHRKTVKTNIAGYKDFQTLSQEALERENELIRSAERKRKFSMITSFIGPGFGLLALILVPSWFTGIMFGVHVILFVLFWRLSSRRSARPWGVVFDRGDRSRLSQTVIRLFEPKFGRLLMTKVTGREGKYGFLVGDKEYILTPSRSGYQFKGEKTHVRPADGIIQKDVPMERRSGS